MVRSAIRTLFGRFGQQNGSHGQDARPQPGLSSTTVICRARRSLGRLGYGCGGASALRFGLAAMETSRVDCSVRALVTRCVLAARLSHDDAHLSRSDEAKGEPPANFRAGAYGSPPSSRQTSRANRVGREHGARLASSRSAADISADVTRMADPASRRSSAGRRVAMNSFPLHSRWPS
jgi:hypothetical protein